MHTQISLDNVGGYRTISSMLCSERIKKECLIPFGKAILVHFGRTLAAFMTLTRVSVEIEECLRTSARRNRYK